MSGDIAIDWTTDDSFDALGEGWDIFECFGSDDGPWQIQKVDAEDRWPDDTDVWVHVYRRAANGSELHQRALDFIRQHNPMEWDSITKHLTERG